MLKKLFISSVAAMVIGAPVVHAATHNYQVTSHTTNAHNVSIKVPAIKGLGTSSINKQIASFQKSSLKDFKKTYGTSAHADYRFSYNVLTNTKKYLSLKVMASTRAADSATTSKYYTFDKEKGQQVTWKTLQSKRAMINQTIKKQAKNTSFKSVNNQTSFYMNKKNQLVVAFDEGVIAPYSEGTLTYTINLK